MLHAGDDQERRVREALKKGKTTRDIAKEERMSLTPIIAIRKKLFGVESREQNKFSQALALFSKGRKLTEVAIKLKLSAEVAEKYYKDFWALEHMQYLYNFYRENKQTIPYLLRLYNLLKKKGFSSELYNDVPVMFAAIGSFVSQDIGGISGLLAGIGLRALDKKITPLFSEKLAAKAIHNDQLIAIYEFKKKYNIKN